MLIVAKVAAGMTADGQEALVAVLRRRDLPLRVRERAEMVKAASQGQELAQIRRWSGRSAATVRHWLSRYCREGLRALGDAPRADRPVRADAAYHAALERVMTGSPRDLGLLFDVWTSARLSAYLTEQTGVRIAPGWLRVLLSRHRYVTGRPKHTLRHLRDAEEVAVCEAELAAVGGKSSGRAGGE